jgi:hypothetical protein
MHFNPAATASSTETIDFARPASRAQSVDFAGPRPREAKYEAIRYDLPAVDRFFGSHFRSVARSRAGRLSASDGLLPGEDLLAADALQRI